LHPTPEEIKEEMDDDEGGEMRAHARNKNKFAALSEIRTG
jgi:hypothetical protein